MNEDRQEHEITSQMKFIGAPREHIIKTMSEYPACARCDIPCIPHQFGKLFLCTQCVEDIVSLYKRKAMKTYFLLKRVADYAGAIRPDSSKGLTVMFGDENTPTPDGYIRLTEEHGLSTNHSPQEDTKA